MSKQIFLILLVLSSLCKIQSAEADMVKGKVLILLSAADSIPLREGRVHPTGIFLGELTKPAEAMMKAGYQLVFASPGGRRPVIDRDSYNCMYWKFSSLSNAENIYKLLVENGLEQPLILEDFARDPNKLKEFVGVFVPGGHGPLTDLYHQNAFESDQLNLNVGAILSFFHKSKRPTGLICHAVALAAIPHDGSGKSPYKGYRMTVITRFSEWMNEDMLGVRVVNGHLKSYPVDFLRAAGVKLSLNHIPMIPHVVEDRELMTGQDPFAAGLMAIKFVEKLNQYTNTK